MKTTTRESYVKRIECVIAYIAENLERPLDLNVLADKANLSPYHFHRIYVALMGETIASTVRRQRLHLAAAKLLSSTAQLSAITRETGYNSTQAFSRAFKEVYHIAPQSYRERGGITDVIHFANQNKEEKQIAYEVSIEYREPRKVIGLRHLGDYMKIEHSFQRMMARATKYNLIPSDANIYAIFYDDPTIIPAKNLQADICMAVAVDFQQPDDESLSLTYTPGGRCAVLKHIGPFSELNHAYDWIYGEWLSDNDEEPDDQPQFQEHKSDPRITLPANLETNICLPLKAKDIQT